MYTQCVQLLNPSSGGVKFLVHLSMSVHELEQFYDVQFPKIYSYFFYKVLNREIAEDLTSQTFLKFARCISKQEIPEPKAFLFGIAKHVMIDFLRTKYQKNETPLIEDDETLVVEPSDVPIIHIFDYLEKLLPKLPEKQSLVLRLRFIDRLSLSEIAEKLGKDVNYVSTTQKRAFQTIRNILACTDAPTNIVGE